MHGHAERHRHPPGGELLEHLQVHLVGLAAAAELLRVRQRQQAGPTQGGEHLSGELAG